MLFANETSYDTRTLSRFAKRVMWFELKPSQREGVLLRIVERGSLPGRVTIPRVKVSKPKKTVTLIIPRYTGPDWREWIVGLGPVLAQLIAFGFASLVKRDLILRNAERFRTPALAVPKFADAGHRLRNVTRRWKVEDPAVKRAALILRYELARRRLIERRDKHLRIVKSYQRHIRVYHFRLKSLRQHDRRYGLRKATA